MDKYLIDGVRKGAGARWTSPAEFMGLWCLGGLDSALGVPGSSVWKVLEQKCSLGNSSIHSNCVRDPGMWLLMGHPLVRLTNKVDFLQKSPHGWIPL